MLNFNCKELHLMQEQIGFALQLTKPILDSQEKSFEVTEVATVDYNTWLQHRLSRSVWTECNSYYQIDRKRGSKNVATFPGPVSLFWWLTRTPLWNKFHGVAAEAWEKQRRINKIKGWGGLTALALVVVLGYIFGDVVTVRTSIPGILESLRRILSSRPV